MTDHVFILAVIEMDCNGNGRCPCCHRRRLDEEAIAKRDCPREDLNEEWRARCFCRFY